MRRSGPSARPPGRPLSPSTSSTPSPPPGREAPAPWYARSTTSPRTAWPCTRRSAPACSSRRSSPPPPLPARLSTYTAIVGGSTPWTPSGAAFVRTETLATYDARVPVALGTTCVPRQSTAQGTVKEKAAVRAGYLVGVRVTVVRAAPEADQRAAGLQRGPDPGAGPAGNQRHPYGRTGLVTRRPAVRKGPGPPGAGRAAVWRCGRGAPRRLRSSPGRAAPASGRGAYRAPT